MTVLPAQDCARVSVGITLLSRQNVLFILTALSFGETCFPKKSIIAFLILTYCNVQGKYVSLLKPLCFTEHTTPHGKSIRAKVKLKRDAHWEIYTSVFC